MQFDRVMLIRLLCANAPLAVVVVVVADVKCGSSKLVARNGVAATQHCLARASSRRCGCAEVDEVYWSLSVSWRLLFTVLPLESWFASTR